MKPRFLILFILILVAAAGFRLPRLFERPLHTDEAIHAVKLGEILEHNGYRYDRHEYHGPTLNYFTIIPALIRGQTTYQQLDEFTLRIVTVFFGLTLILLLLWLRRQVNTQVLLWSAALTAFSPVMVFYSRYYIMEILLVAFSFGAIVAGARYLESRHWGWALTTGVFIGLMHATKETCIIVWGVMGLALLPVIIANWQQLPEFWRSTKAHLALLVLGAAVISMLFFSSFGANPRGILDSVLTFTNYFHKAGDFEIHIYPWYWYFQVLLFNPSPMGINWTEIFILIMALLGLYAIFTGKTAGWQGAVFLHYMAWFTVLLTVIYSIIPYKTPWIVLGFWHGLIIIAAVGIVFVYAKIQKMHVLRSAFALFVTIGMIHLAWLAYICNFRLFDNPYNPWVFSHPGQDVFTIEDRVREVARCHPEGLNMRIDVICPAGDYWPLPWYLRDMPNIGWWNQVNLQTPAAPMVLVSPTLETELAYKLYELPPPGKRNMYMPLFDDYVELRPTVEIRGYVVKSLYDTFYYQQE